MSVKVIGWVWDNSQSEGAARLVLLAIADCANAEGKDAWPSMAELCRKTRLSERGVQKAIRRLEDLGELDVKKNAGRGRTNRYIVVMETPNVVRGSGRENPEQSSPRTEFAPEPGSPKTPNVVRKTPNHVRPEPSVPVLEPSLDSKPGRAAPRAEAIPEWALPLVHRIHAAGLPGIRWNLRGDDWFMVDSLIKAKGIEAMADYAARATQSSARPVVSARYFLSGWKELTNAPPDGTVPPELRAVSGGAPLGRRQVETDALFERAMQRARALDAMEAQGEP